MFAHFMPQTFDQKKKKKNTGNKTRFERKSRIKWSNKCNISSDRAAIAGTCECYLHVSGALRHRRLARRVGANTANVCDGTPGIIAFRVESIVMSGYV